MIAMESAFVNARLGMENFAKIERKVAKLIKPSRK